jgi:hypothetical protein
MMPEARRMRSCVDREDGDARGVAEVDGEPGRRARAGVKVEGGSSLSDAAVDVRAEEEKGLDVGLGVPISNVANSPAWSE